MSAMTVASVAMIRRQYCSGRPMTARAIKVEQPSMAQLQARMERDGLIRRAPPRDRRSSLIALTDKARAKLPAGRGILEAGNREAMSGLSDEEVAPLIDLLQRVLANAEEMERREAPWGGLVLCRHSAFWWMAARWRSGSPNRANVCSWRA